MTDVAQIDRYTDGINHPLLQCRLRGIRVIGPQHLVFDLSPDNCTDMTGAIALAKVVMPEVARIDTYAGTERDTSYRKKSSGEWVARMSREAI